MTEGFEERVRAALVAGVGDPSVGGLADRARSRLRSRRRTTATVGAVVLAVAAVPVTLALTLPGDTPDGSPVTPPTTSDTTPSTDGDAVPSGFRVESWRNLTVSVPPDWGYGGGTDWCATDGAPGGAEVTRPEAGARSVRCHPRLSYGLYFGDSSAIRWGARSSGDVWQYSWEDPAQVRMYPEHAWLGLVRRGDQHALVVTSTGGLTRAVMDTVSWVDDVDPNGCAPREESLEPLRVGDRWSVCRYTGDGWLAQSELLNVEDSAAFRAAINSAPLLDGDGTTCALPGPPVGFVLAGSGADLGTARIVFEDDCANGVFLSGTVRDLTEEVLYWAITPGWSGGVDGSVPLPDEFR